MIFDNLLSTSSSSSIRARYGEHVLEFGDRCGVMSGDSDLTKSIKSINSYLMEIAEPAHTYEERVSKLKSYRRYLLQVLEKELIENVVCAGAEELSFDFKNRILFEIERGNLPGLEGVDDGIDVICDIVAGDFFDGKIQRDTTSQEALSNVVDEMVSAAKNGLPPNRPYFAKDNNSPLEFLLSEYGSFLNDDPQKNVLYQDQIGWIHPSKKKLTNILGSAEQYGSGAWGEDLLQALRNYFANKGGAKALAEVLPPKKQRNDQRFMALGLSREDLSDQRKRSAASFLNL